MANHTIDCEGCGEDMRVLTGHDEEACKRAIEMDRRDCLAGFKKPLGKVECAEINQPEFIAARREFVLRGGEAHTPSFIHQGQELLKDGEEITVREGCKVHVWSDEDQTRLPRCINCDLVREVFEASIGIKASLSTVEVDRVLTQETVKRPPLGAEPRWIWMQHRIHDLVEALTRFNEAKELPPLELVKELHDHLTSPQRLPPSER